MAVRHLEDDHQAALITWARLQKTGAEKLFAIPNGGKRKQKEGARLKAQGVIAGIPDLCLPLMRKGYGGLYIELKAPKTPTSPPGTVKSHQLAKINELREDGYLVFACWGWEAAKVTIQEYLS